MTSDELQKYKKVQSIAKEAVEFLKSFIREGITEQDIRESTEKFLYEKGVSSFRYYGIGAFVFVGERTTISISGREYQATDIKVQSNDLVTVDLSPEIEGFGGDLARSFIIENGRVTDAENSILLEIVEGVKTEEELHNQFRNFINEEMSFEQAYTKMNSLIEASGFENLDFKRNLGHSMANHKDDRIYIEAGNKAKFKEVDLFTFEPHIKKENGKYGFKYENIYYFDKGKLQIL